jgi:hypothetical protein
MATLRDHPDEGSNFVVDIGVLDPSDVRATLLPGRAP